MGGDHGLALQESVPDPSHEGSAVIALVRGSVGVGSGPCRIVAANLLTNRFTQGPAPTPGGTAREPALGPQRDGNIRAALLNKRP
jgi:hypothetical protein